MACKYCGSLNLHIEDHPPHRGEYCSDCGKFQHWIKQSQNIETGEIASESQQKYAISLLRKWKVKNISMTARQAGAIISAFKE